MAITDNVLGIYERDIVGRLPLHGHIYPKFAQECRVFRQARQPWPERRWSKIVEKPLEIIVMYTPLPLVRQQAFKVAQAVSYEPALKLLAELYDKVALSASSLVKDGNENMMIAVGMLAAAGLCDVSPVAIRLSTEGKEFIEFLIKSEALKPTEPKDLMKKFIE